jgi:hypothetical protein
MNTVWNFRKIATPLCRRIPAPVSAVGHVIVGKVRWIILVLKMLYRLAFFTYFGQRIDSN